MKGGAGSSTAMDQSVEPYLDHENVVSIYGDGRCLFRAVANEHHRLSHGTGTPIGDTLERFLADQLRQQVVAFMAREGPSLFSAALQYHWDFHGGFHNRLEAMQSPSEYGGEPEMAALAAMLNVQIVVHYRNRAGSIDKAHPPTLYGNSDATGKIILLHTPDRAGQPGHFDLIRPNSMDSDHSRCQSLYRDAEVYQPSPKKRIGMPMHEMPRAEIEYGSTHFVQDCVMLQDADSYEVSCPRTPLKYQADQHKCFDHYSTEHPESE